MNLTLALQDLASHANANYDLAELSLHLAREEYPDLDVDATLSELAGMAHEAAQYIRGDFPARVAGLCRYLFHDMGFRGNVEEYYDPRNSYLNQVLERRTGIPISLSIVTISVGRQAGLHVTGVGLPGHFLVKAVDGSREILVDPFHGGRQVTREECPNLVRQATGLEISIDARHFQDMSLRLITTRILNNLKAAYLKQMDFARAVRAMERLLLIQPDDALQRRDLGMALARAGFAGRAIAHLEFYLAAHPDDPSIETVRELLSEARKEVARWN